MDSQFVVKAIMLVVLALASATAFGHKASDSFLYVDLDSSGLRIDVAVRDIALLVPIDLDSDRQITWRELQATRADITRVIERGLTLETARGQRCQLDGQQWGISRHSDGHYVASRYRVRCPGDEPPARLGYNLLFDRDSLHRGLMELRQDGETSLAVLAPDKQVLPLKGHQPEPWRTFSTFIHEGVIHLLIGLDHILFLLVLVLPASLVVGEPSAHPQPSLRERLMQLAGIVTAFTIAHSLTLALSALDIIRLPIAWVETVIALSIAVAALNVAWPFLGRKTWKLAFGFGLIHGFGFASVLSGLTSGTANLTIALAGFNLGVELGQLALLITVFPLLYLFGHSPLYRRAAVPLILLGVAITSLTWVAERATQI
ncbi:HupE/UreJ family protein [Marinobacter salinexigens]|uniref:HupE/UreJ family protein n=1 Tax=Marinobacter salinexigens TaxID=2919747 RepID=A0A5B0VI68_9GAMM|nr:HupE/UreJ family protein [Marinobacter salinexigens]KAA1174296.1 HupE/UreJ family protein [Marinobacter salinexigens]